MQLLERRFAGLLAVEIGLHRVVVEFDRGFDQRRAIFLRPFEQIGGNLFVVIFRAEAFVFPDDRLHADQIDDALEIALGADRQLQQTGRPPTRGP